MMKNTELYYLFADLLRYPQDNYRELVESTSKVLQDVYPEAAQMLSPFVDYIREHDSDAWEELYTKTFDVQPVCYLDLGYVIFGEDYKRGAFLLHMQNEQLMINNDCGTDLPDNISNVLVLLTKHHNQVFLNELTGQIVIPAVEKMIGEFAQARVELKIRVMRKLHNAIIQEELNQSNVYRNVFESLLCVLREDFAEAPAPLSNEEILTSQHHKAFFGKNSINAEVHTIATNYKLD